MNKTSSDYQTSQNVSGSGTKKIEETYEQEEEEKFTNEIPAMLVKSFGKNLLPKKPPSKQVSKLQVGDSEIDSFSQNI